MEPRKYTRKEIKERKRLGYYPLSAAEQVLYIIIYKVKHDLRSLRLRFKLWRKPKKDYYHCCVWCKHFEQCRSELEEKK